MFFRCTKTERNYINDRCFKWQMSINTALLAWMIIVCVCILFICWRYRLYHKADIMCHNKTKSPSLSTSRVSGKRLVLAASHSPITYRQRRVQVSLSHPLTHIHTLFSLPLIQFFSPSLWIHQSLSFFLFPLLSD